MFMFLDTICADLHLVEASHPSTVVLVVNGTSRVGVVTATHQFVLLKLQL